MLLISLAWTVALVAAPLTIASGSVTGLNGAANRIDYSSLWGTLPPTQGFVYLLGDIECHQIASRTIFINGNEMPVCARDASLFFFLTLGFLLASVVTPRAYVSWAIVGLLPGRIRSKLEKGSRPMLFTWVLGILSVAPVGIDGGVQLLTSYESNNVLRFLTGIPAGIFIGLAIGLMVQSLHVLNSWRPQAESGT